MSTLQESLVPDAPVILRLAGTSTTALAVRFAVSVMRGGSAVDQWELRYAAAGKKKKKKKKNKKKKECCVIRGS